MNSKFCQNCSNRVMLTMRMCPSCGSKDFQPSPPSLNSTPTPTPSQSGTLNASAAPNKSLTPAHLGRRFAAYLIDIALLATFNAIALAIAYFVVAPNQNEGFNGVSTLTILLSYIAPFVYLTVMPASSKQATYGKAWMGLKLVTIQGERLTRTQAFIRVLMTTIIPFVAVISISIAFGGMALQSKAELGASIGVAWLIALPVVLLGPYLLVFFNPQKQTLFDLIVKTIVVKD